ncbi:MULTISPECIES: DUF2510 domain-containing protein [Mycobacterium]|uniref:DUF2510 domain-containing protein n=1 Tax=Mycobacterium TaxID=1763 RepID=UPI00351CE242
MSPHDRPRGTDLGGYPHPGRLFQLRLIEHIGALIFWQQRTTTVTGTLEQCEAAYRRTQTQNLCAGWWSPASILLFNWIAPFSNLSAIKRVRAQSSREIAHVAPAGCPPGWHPDPTGQATQRYWDGATWTHWTHPSAHR